MEVPVESFDVVAVVSRAVGLDLAVASDDELQWADRAGDRIRGWLDAWQAQVQFEQTLPRPLPDVDPARSAEAEPGIGVGGAAAALPDEAAADSGSANAGGSDGPLPSLGPGLPAAESFVERERKARRMFLLSALPAFAEALRAGRVTTGHVDVLAAAIDRLPPAIRDRLFARGDELLRDAVGLTPEKFSRAVQRAIARAYDDEGIDRAAALRARSCLRRGVDDATKMHWLRVDIDPDRGLLLFNRLDAEREAIFRSGGGNGLTREQIELQALLNLLAAPTATASAPAEGGDAQPSSPAPPGRVQKSSAKKVHGLVLIDATTMLFGAHDRTVCENASGVPLPVDTVRRLLCIAEITYGLLINGRVVASVVKNDLATSEQRHELRMMYATCAGPDCTMPFDTCQIHHIIARSRHGPTDVALMVPLCTRHHDAVHHNGWTLTIDTLRTLTWTAPDGRVIVCPFVPLADRDRVVPTGTDQRSLFEPAHPPAA